GLFDAGPRTTSPELEPRLPVAPPPALRLGSREVRVGEASVQDQARGSQGEDDAEARASARVEVGLTFGRGVEDVGVDPEVAETEPRRDPEGSPVEEAGAVRSCG